VPVPLAPALADLRPLLLDPHGLVRAVAAGRRRGVDPPPWRRVELRPVELKGGRHLQVVRHDERQAYTANVPYEPGGLDTVVDELLALPFGSWHVATTAATLTLRVTKRGDAQVHRAAAAPAAPQPGHDRAKPRLIESGDPLFDVIGGDAAKRRQVDAFLRTLDPVLDPVAARRPLRVVDLGCGNAYLTFAAYRYLTAGRGLPVELVGVDVRAQARERNAGVAGRLGWSDGMRFVEGTILAAPVEGADVCLALHACDTATDEALARAVRWAAPVVLAAPCCHHDLQRQLRAGSAPAPYGLLTGAGILRERFADVLTDALRAAVLRLAGYRVDVVEFVESRHTPRNLLLRAVRTGARPTPELQEDYDALVRAWGVRPRLAELLPEVVGVSR
jgi:SAM-dependent methyltransferase